MKTIKQDRRARSADVQMYLSINGRILNIGHLGRDYVILDDPIDHPPADAEISLSVDGKVSRWQVRLVDGLSASGSRTRIYPTLG